MKKFVSGSLALAAVAAVSAPAFAETFEGPYFGIQAGWSQSKIGTTNTDIGTVQVDRSRDAATGGIFAGYNYKPADKIVLSVEGGFNLGIDDTVNGGTNDVAASINPKYSFDIGARAGYLVNDATLVYVRGGYENLRSGVRTDDGDTVLSAKNNFDGWSVGGGVERAITDKISARIEYRYSDLSDSGEKFDRHQALVGVAYHF